MTRLDFDHGWPLAGNPEDVEMLPTPRVGNDVYARADIVEPFGKENDFDLFPSDGYLDEAVIATIEGQMHVEEGREVAMRLPEDPLYLFDRGSGDAVRHLEVQREELSTILE